MVAAERRGARKVMIVAEPSVAEFAAHLEHQHEAGVLSALRDLPDELRSKANLGVAARCVEVLKSEGAAAFLMPREAAAWHEAGHAIVGRHEGYKITKVSIVRSKRTFTPEQIAVLGEVWAGVVDRDVADCQIIGPDTNPRDDLKWARMLIAGKRVEDITGWGAAASALDEPWLGQFVTGRAAEKLGVDGEELWYQIQREVDDICTTNREVLNRMSGELFEREWITGGVLKKMLRAVKQVPVT